MRTCLNIGVYCCLVHQYVALFCLFSFYLCQGCKLSCEVTSRLFQTAQVDMLHMNIVHRWLDESPKYFWHMMSNVHVGVFWFKCKTTTHTTVFLETHFIIIYPLKESLFAGMTWSHLYIYSRFHICSPLQHQLGFVYCWAAPRDQAGV